MNPGSSEAIYAGCRCPIVDNNHGERPVWPATETQPEGWYIALDCPIHGRANDDG